jgi:hypothetical protein
MEKLSKQFWSNIKTISQYVEYTYKKQVKIPSFEEMKLSLTKNGFKYNHIINNQNQPTQLGILIFEYFKHRANILNNFIEKYLLDAENAKQLFEQLYQKCSPSCPIPMNKQKGKKNNLHI